jgi:hypothetical protein
MIRGMIEDAASPPHVGIELWPKDRKILEREAMEFRPFGLDEQGHAISSRNLKKTMALEKVSPMTWKRAIKQVHASKKDHVRGEPVQWRLQGQSLVKQTAESFGF